MNIIGQRESNALTFIRVGAMAMIVWCHLFQAYGVYLLSSIFNVGVQVFFIMSGYLYGRKHIENWAEWGKKRMKKLYVPYLVFVGASLMLYCILKPEMLSWFTPWIYLLNLQGLSPIIPGISVSGINHLWFMTAIMVAYFFTPCLQRFQHHPVEGLMISIVLLILAFVLLPMNWVWIVEWILLYAIGYYSSGIFAFRGGVIARNANYTFF